MDLSGLLSLVEDTAAFREVVAAPGDSGRHAVVVLDAAVPAFMAALRQAWDRPFMLLTATPERARGLAQQLRVWLPVGLEVRLLPEPDLLPYERLSSDPATEWDRLSLLSALAASASGLYPLVVASAAACAARTPARDDFAQSVVTLKPGTRFDLEDSLRRWQAMGYEADVSVEVPGTFSRRGGIVDVYSPSEETPVRIELFGDVIESLRSFDPATQRSRAAVAQATIVPAREMLGAVTADRSRTTGLLSPVVRPLDREAPETAERITEDLARLRAGEWFPGAEFYAPLVNTGCVFDYLPPSSVVVLDSPAALEDSVAGLERQGLELRQQRVAAGELPAD
ncbi:MAG: hypothetical protein HY680_09965, partial [Chloroflexi bacterium]|nr:hypothetical protein [Chloroflexota bacterium]